MKLNACPLCGSIRVGVIASKQKAKRGFDSASDVTAQAACNACGAKTRVITVANGCGLEATPDPKFRERVAAARIGRMQAAQAAKMAGSDFTDDYTLEHYGHADEVKELNEALKSERREAERCAPTDIATAHRQACAEWNAGEVSPGVPPKATILRKARRRKIVWAG